MRMGVMKAVADDGNGAMVTEITVVNSSDGGHSGNIVVSDGKSGDGSEGNSGDSDGSDQC